jgi:hypothetical protein
MGPTAGTRTSDPNPLTPLPLLFPPLADALPSRAPPATPESHSAVAVEERRRAKAVTSQQQDAPRLQQGSAQVHPPRPLVAPSLRPLPLVVHSTQWPCHWRWGRAWPLVVARLLRPLRQHLPPPRRLAPFQLPVCRLEMPLALLVALVVTPNEAIPAHRQPGLCLGAVAPSFKGRKMKPSQSLPTTTNEKPVH